mgnify:CR=1 FL=1
MTKMEIFALESRIRQINHAIAQMRKEATSATKANVEMAIEMLALPELAKVESQLAEAKQKSADMDKFLNNPIFTERK